MESVFLKTLKQEKTQVPPVWMMRQAGRYHSHYQALKARHSFMELCMVPELAAEVAMGPIQDFDFDAAILFSDLLFPFKALGQGLDYTDQGPQLGFRLTPENFKELKPWPEAVLEMGFQKKAMQLTREKLPASKGLIGFVGGPWTLFVYSVEGTHAGSLIASKKYLQSPLWTEFSEMMTNFLIENIRMQFAGGADVVMIFDTAAGELSPALYNEKIVPSLARLAQEFPGKLGYYSKGTTAAHFTDSLFNSIPWAGQGFDHRFNLPQQLQSRALAQKKGFVQGNFDQALLHLEPADFKLVLRKYLETFRGVSADERRGWVCGLGHGVLPKTPEANVRYFVEEVRRFFHD